MRELVQADQRTTPQRSALDFLFVRLSVACAWLGERSEPTCIKTSTRLGAKVIIFSLYRLFFLSNGLNFLGKRGIINTLN